MSDKYEDTQRRLRKCYRSAMRGGIINEWDYIAKCRPIDLLRAANAIEQLTAERDELRGLLSDVIDERDRIEQLESESQPGMMEYRLAESLLDVCDAASRRLKETSDE